MSQRGFWAPDPCVRGSAEILFLEMEAPIMNLGISSQIVHRAVPALAGIAFLSVFFASPAPGQMRAIDVDASKVIGTIRSLQGLNNGPAGRAGQPSLIQQYHELGIDTVRTHDSGADINAYPPLPPRGPALGIFPKWEADPRVPESYDFSRTDEVVNAIIAAGAEVYFRLGSAHDARMPPDFDKYADICQHVVMHYNGGWANGYHYNIRYWEFWNEPNLSVEWWGFPGIIKMMPRSEWDGPPEKFFELYEKVARAVVAYDTDLKVGANGYAPQSHSPYREEFIEYCARHKVPFDFFSWHAYMENSGDPYEPVRMAREVRQLPEDNRSGGRQRRGHLRPLGRGPGVGRRGVGGRSGGHAPRQGPGPDAGPAHLRLQRRGGGSQRLPGRPRAPRW